MQLVELFIGIGLAVLSLFSQHIWKSMPIQIAWAGFSFGALLFAWGIVGILWNRQILPIGPTLLFVACISGIVGSIVWYRTVQTEQAKEFQTKKAGKESEQPKQPIPFVQDNKTTRALESIDKRLSILENLQKQASSKKYALEEKYPKGYYLFASNENIIVPQGKEMTLHFDLNWDTCKVAYIDDSFVDIALKHFHYLPTDITIENLDVVVERKIGSVASGIKFNNIGLFVELIDDKGKDNITYVIGFKSDTTSAKGKKWDIDPKVEKFLKTRNKPILPGIDTNAQEHMRINDMLMSTGWKLLQ